MWDIEMLCEPPRTMGEDILRALAWFLAERGMAVWWGPGVVRLRFAAAPGVCRPALAELSRDLTWLGLPVRLYQLNSARPIAATERL